MRWEYRVVGFDTFGINNTTVFDSEHPDGLRKIQTKGGAARREVVILTIARELNAMGADGWELVTKDGHDYRGWYTLKRPVTGS